MIIVNKRVNNIALRNGVAYGTRTGRSTRGAPSTPDAKSTSEILSTERMIKSAGAAWIASMYPRASYRINTSRVQNMFATSNHPTRTCSHYAGRAPPQNGVTTAQYNSPCNTLEQHAKPLDGAHHATSSETQPLSTMNCDASPGRGTRVSGRRRTTYAVFWAERDATCGVKCGKRHAGGGCAPNYSGSG